MKILKRKKLDRLIHACPGDTMNLSYTDKFGVKTVVLSQVLERTYTFDESVIFEDEFEGRPVLGGFFIEQQQG